MTYKDTYLTLENDILNNTRKLINIANNIKFINNLIILLKLPLNLLELIISLFPPNYFHT